MTLARTALRLCVVEALSGSVGDRPTIAQERVYDSRISDFAPETSLDDAKPTIILLTDNDEGEALSQQNGGPPFRRMIEVVLEIGMTQSVKDGDGFIVGYPDTDARHEASLDYLEFQAVRRLAYDPAPMSVLFRKIARIRKAECHRQVLDDSSVKVAARILTLTCEVSDDQVHVFTASGDQPSGIDALPEPLRSVAAALPEGSSGADAVAAIIAAMSGLAVPALDGIDITSSSDDDPENDVHSTVEPKAAFSLRFNDPRNSQYIGQII